MSRKILVLSANVNLTYRIFEDVIRFYTLKENVRSMRNKKIIYLNIYQGFEFYFCNKDLKGYNFDEMITIMDYPIDYVTYNTAKFRVMRKEDHAIHELQLDDDSVVSLVSRIIARRR